MQSVAYILLYESDAMENPSSTEFMKPTKTVNVYPSSSLLRDVVGGVLIACSAFLLFNHFKNPPAEDNSKIIVVDFAKVIQSYPDGASAEEVEVLMVRTNESILRLRDAGFIVLDSSAVLAAPDYIYLPALDELSDLDAQALEAESGAK